MNQKIALEIIAANREYLQINSNMALDNLASIHRDFDDIQDEAVIMSLALNDCVAYMRFHADYDRAMALSRQMLDRYHDSEHQYFIAKHISILGRCMIQHEQYRDAQTQLLQALQIADTELSECDETTQLRVDILHDLAMANDMAGGAPQITTQYLEKALTLLEGTPFEARRGLCLMGLGNAKYTEKKTEEALAYYIRARDIFDDDLHHLNLATAYSNIALCYFDLHKVEPAEENILLAHELRLRTGNDETIANSHYVLARFYEVIGNDEKAFTNLLTCRDYALKSANKIQYKKSLEWLEKIATKRNDPDTAALYREESYRANLS
jgi:tetratricopeptide (TPR) repeat protein